MGKIKFNQMRLLDCKARIDNMVRELQENTDKATALIEGLGPDERYLAMQSVKNLIASTEGLCAMSAKLAMLADLYSECERTVNNIVSRLTVPVSILSRQTALATSTPFITEYSVSHTMPRDLLVESWVMELIYSEASSPE